MARPGYSAVMATIAVFVALGGGAYAAARMPAGSVSTRAIRNGAVTTQKLADGSVTAAKLAPGAIAARQSDADALETVASAQHAASADSAATATHASTADAATTAGLLDGLSPQSFQSRVTGGCGQGAALSQINADGSVACAAVPSNVQAYAGRLVTPIDPGDVMHRPFLTIPGVMHVDAFVCDATTAAADLATSDLGNVDLWTVQGSGASSYEGSNWSSVTTPQAFATGSQLYDLGVGSGAGAKVIRLTVSWFTDGSSSCTFQAGAEVVTAAA